MRGYSLVETMLVVAISSIVAFGILSALRTHQKATITTQRNIEFQDITAMLSMYFSSSDSCATLFKDHKISTKLGNILVPIVLPAESIISINPISFQGSEIATVGILKNGLIPTEIGFTKVYKAFTNTINNFYVFEFKFAADKSGDFYGGLQKEKSYQLFFKTTLDGEVLTCGLVDSSDEGKCILSGKVYDMATVPFCK